MLEGLIRDEHLGQAEEEFPGIRAVYLGCAPRPRTFLDLVVRYLESVAGRPTRAAGPRPRTQP
jgi:hypothetical protein